jgi:hypothetical protein
MFLDLLVLAVDGSERNDLHDANWRTGFQVVSVRNPGQGEKDSGANVKTIPG